jgi:hypothetical protein
MFMLLVPCLKRCWQRIIRTAPTAALVVGTVAVLAGCSMVSLGYNRLPDLGMVWLNRQLPLSDRQSAQARTDMNELLTWHRRTQLPATADVLRRWQGMATSDISAADACREWTQVRTLLDTITQQAVPAMARLATGTTAEQLAELQRNQRKSNDEYRETYSASARRGWFTAANATAPINLNAQAGLDKRLNTLRERYGQLYGALSDEQVALLRSNLRASSFQPERNLAERERRQAELLDTLVSLQNPVGQNDAERARWAQTRVQGWLAGFASSPTPGYKGYVQQLVRDGCEQFAALHRSTTPEQRSQAVRTLQSYETELRGLARTQN